MTTPTPDDLRLLSVAELAALWGIAPRAVLHLIRRAGLPAVRLPGRRATGAGPAGATPGPRGYRVRRADALAWLAARTRVEGDPVGGEAVVVPPGGGRRRAKAAGQGSESEESRKWRESWMKLVDQ